MRKKRQIDLSKITKPNKAAHYTEQKTYRIYLGNSYIVVFQSLRYAQRFMAESNRVLNQKADEILYLSSNIHYLYVTHFRELKISETVSIHQKFAEFNKAMNLSLDRSSWANGNYFLFTHLQNALSFLEQIIDAITKIIKPGEASIGKVNSVRSQLQAIRLFLQLWPDQPFTAILTSQTINAMTIKAPKP
jgi:hypothetical protein